MILYGVASECESPVRNEDRSELRRMGLNQCSESG